MKKKLICGALATALVLTAAGCGGGGGDNVGVDYEFDAEILASLEEQYYPDASKIVPQFGQIDVEMILGKMLPGWKAVANVYMDIHPGVYVNIDENQSSQTYADNLKNALNSSDSEWDIVQGNFQNTIITSRGVNMFSSISQKNPYAGKNKYWDDVLSVDAYKTDKSGGSQSVYILNSECLSTGWFVQREAFDAAVSQGWLNNEGKSEMPVTWDDIISLAEYMTKAGYKNPLGIAGDGESISSSQFAWLFRVYGDQYYREHTADLMPHEGDYNYNEGLNFKIKETDTQPENQSSYLVSQGRLMNMILDKDSPDYIGPTSDKYKEFIGQLAKMKPYVGPDFQSNSLDLVRSKFQYQTEGKNSPQILLDYSGYFLNHTADSASKGTVSYFDYPYMTGDQVSWHFVRDVGGNGGYLSIVDHKPEQNALNLDFIMFFMSPYGQSVYYRALENAKVAPDGLSTVQHKGKNIFAVPQAWAEFFADATLKFNGLCDMSAFGNVTVYHFNGKPNTVQANRQCVWYLFSNDYTIDDYAENWYKAVFAGYEDLCGSMKWNKKMYLNPEKDPTGTDY